MTQDQSSVPGEISPNNIRFMEAVRRGDDASMAAVYTETAWIFPPNAAARTEREAIREFWQSMLNLGVTNVKLETVEFQPHDDTGWESGRATVIARDESVVDRLQYVVVWKKEDGQWKWHRDIWNSSQATG